MEGIQGWLFLLVTVVAWGLAEIFYKKGNIKNEKYSHLKTVVFVGFGFGITGLIMLLQNLDEFKAINFIYYLPVSAMYIISMACSYFGVRFIEESISDPIENSSCAIVPVLGAIVFKNTFEWYAIVGVIVVVIGILGVGFVENIGKTDVKKKLGKKLAIIALAMPFCYALLDAVGTFLDDEIMLNIDRTWLVGVTEDNIESIVNVCYFLTFFLVGLGVLIFLLVKKEGLFKALPQESLEVNLESREVTTNKTLVERIIDQKYKILAALCELIGQITYVYTLSTDDNHVAAVIDGAGVVVISLLLSRFILKEKLSKLQYGFILLILVGIVALSF